MHSQVVHPDRNLPLGGMPMTFRIERLVGQENEIVLRVSGHVHFECVDTLRELVEIEKAKICFDLSEVTLADRDSATFLAICKLKGIELKNCPAYLREWVSEEQERMTP
jgi:hypothetical protein